MRSRHEHYSTDLLDRIGDSRLDGAACYGHDPEMWFALPGTAAETYAKQLCNACPVQAECQNRAGLARRRRRDRERRQANAERYGNDLAVMGR